MKRRQFLTNSLAAGSLAPGFNGNAHARAPQPAVQNLATPGQGRARFEELNKALDRGAMQRGWANEVDPGYRHAPQSAIEAFKDRKFGIRIHWGLYCLDRQ